MDVRSKELLEGRERPLQSTISLEICDGLIVPVVWAVDTWICAYCRMQSKCPQALHKHMRTKHMIDMRIHNHLMVKSKDESINGRTGVPMIKTEQEYHATDTREPVSTARTDDNSKKDEIAEDTANNSIEDTKRRPKKRIRVVPLPTSKTRDIKWGQRNFSPSPITETGATGTNESHFL